MTLQETLDPGESSAIALSLEYENATLLMDELRGRKVARQLGLNVTGTLGVIAQAKISGIIPSVKPI